MNIETVICYLNKTKKCSLSSEYYTHIKIWEDWWRGFHKPFHQFREINGRECRTRELYSMKMGKKVCEDWASILLNEKTRIVINHKASSEFVQGTAEEPGGIFFENDFWVKGNALIEKAFYFGTGAVTLRLKKMNRKNGVIQPGVKTRIALNFLPADQIIPLTIREGRIVEVAFASEILVSGKKQIYLETHELEADGYRITNEYFKEDGAGLTKLPLPEWMAPVIHTHSETPLFVLVSPNIVNNIKENNGLGISVFANAIDNLEGVDLAYNNFNRDLKLGGKKVFYAEDMIQYGENGQEITPDDICQQLFLKVGDASMSRDSNNKVQEFNPSLRVQENKDGIQAQLDYLSFKCGLGTKHYQFNAGQIVTATQYMGDKQELIQNASKHYIVVEKALRDLVRAILWAGKEICGAAVNSETGIKVQFDDSYIIDKESERLRDQQEVNLGLLNAWEYRMKWHGEDEATAREMVESSQGIGFGGDE